MVKKLLFQLYLQGMGSCGGKDTNKKNENVDSAVVAVTVNNSGVLAKSSRILFNLQLKPAAFKDYYKKENESSSKEKFSNIG
jgi:hypothetical protein